MVKSHDLAASILWIIGIAASTYAVFQVYKISALQFNAVADCPHAFGIPACYVVLLCYMLITAAWIFGLKASSSIKPSFIFLLGFAPAFLLAATGSVGEIFDFVSCPKTASNFPKCFISFAFLIGLAIIWYLYFKFKNNSNY